MVGKEEQVKAYNMLVGYTETLDKYMASGEIMKDSTGSMHVVPGASSGASEALRAWGSYSKYWAKTLDIGANTQSTGKLYDQMSQNKIWIRQRLRKGR